MEKDKVQKEKFRDSFLLFASESSNKSFDVMTAPERSRLLAQFYVLKILKYESPGSLSCDDDELDESFCDGANDLGVDFIHRSDNLVTIIQCKYHKPKTNESKDSLEAFRSVLNRIYTKFVLNQKMRSDLFDAIYDIDWRADNFELIFLSLGKIQEQDKDDPSIVCDKCPDEIDLRCNLTILDESDLNIKLREVKSSMYSSDEVVTLMLSESSDSNCWLVYDEGNIRSYVGIMKASQIYEMYKNKKNKLFTLNIRGPIGDNSSTNKGIIQSAINSPKLFYLYNNGISAIAKTIEEEDHNMLKCSGFSIINGAQTVKSIYKAFHKSKESCKEARVLIRVSEIPMKTSSAAENLDNITRFNNTQNQIKAFDFRSNDHVQKSLVSFFESLKAPEGKKYKYQNKRMAEREKGRIVIKMDDFVKAIYSFQFGPADYHGGNRHLYDTSELGGYHKLFGDPSGALQHSTMSYYAGIWFMCQTIRELHSKYRLVLKNDAALESDPESVENLLNQNKALERKYAIYYATFLSLKQTYKFNSKDVDADISKFSNYKIYSDAQVIHSLNFHVQHACTILIRSYQDKTQMSMPHRDFYRNVKVLGDILLKIKSDPNARNLPILI